VGGAEAGVEAEEGVELGEKLLGEGKQFFIGRERHGRLLLEVGDTVGP